MVVGNAADDMTEDCLALTSNVRPQFTTENVLLLLAFTIVSSVMVGQLWRTGFTCDDDMFTATAWQRWGGGAQGWKAVGRASWEMALDQGRFYQLLPYTLTQAVYQLRSFEAVNTIRIAAMFFVLISFTSMLVSLTRDFQMALYASILYSGLVETTYMYNPFHALPLWFNVGIGIMFIAILLFQEGLIRQRTLWICAAAVGYFVSALFYELFLLYGVIFFVLAYLHFQEIIQPRVRTLVRVFGTVWKFGLAAALYVLLYVGFNHTYAHNSYTGKTLSLASFRDVTRTIVGFSISGLDFKGVWPQNWHWDTPAVVVALIVSCASFWCMSRLAREIRPRLLLWQVGLGIGCMLLPNTLFGFMERYRNWLITAYNFYMGSFYAGFAEALVIAALSIWIVNQATRSRFAGMLAAAAIAVFLGIATFSNVTKTEAFYALQRENRKIWDLVEASLATTGGPKDATIIVAPQLNTMSQLNPAIYDYWSFYFSGKFQRPIRVLSKVSEFRVLPPEATAGPVFAFACRDFPEFHAGLFAFGPLNLEAWQKHGQLTVNNAQVGVLGNVRGLSVFGQTSEQSTAKILHSADNGFTVRSEIADLSELSIRR
jgi:hypothetical protein